MNENALLKRITFNTEMFKEKPTIRIKRIAVEHILEILAEDPINFSLYDMHYFNFQRI